jgi:hypothetical protein
MEIRHADYDGQYREQAKERPGNNPANAALHTAGRSSAVEANCERLLGVGQASAELTMGHRQRRGTKTNSVCKRDPKLPAEGARGAYSLLQSETAKANEQDGKPYQHRQQ